MPRRPLLIVAPNLLHGDPNPRSIRAHRLAAGLDGHGFAVWMATFWNERGEPPAVRGAERLLHAADPEAFEAGLGHWAELIDAQLAEIPAGERPTLVCAIGYPVGALSAGARFAERLGCPLILDLGDPWPPGERGGVTAAERERTLAGADALVTTTPELADELRSGLSPDAEILLAPGGGEFATGRRTAEPPLFVQLGTLSAGRADPRPAFEALADLAGRGELELRSHSAGMYEGFDELAAPQRPMLPHQEALALLGGASAAVVFGNVTRSQLPSKAFEIACTETWALCVRDRDDDPAAELLTRTGHAVVAESNTVPAIAAAAREILAREARGERPSPVPEFTWEARIGEIAALAERHARPPG